MRLAPSAAPIAVPVTGYSHWLVHICQSPIWIWLVNYLHLHLHLHLTVADRIKLIVPVVRAPVAYAIACPHIGISPTVHAAILRGGPVNGCAHAGVLHAAAHHHPIVRYTCSSLDIRKGNLHRTDPERGVPEAAL